MAVRKHKRAKAPGGHEVFTLDETLNRMLRDGVPAVLDACRHSRQVIKYESLFLVTDTDGCVYNTCNCGTGLYFKDTRFLNGLKLELEGSVPTLLSSWPRRTTCPASRA